VDYLLHLLTLIAIFAILAIALNLLLGYSGLFSLASGAFYGIGAYTAALLALRQGWDFWATLAAALLLSTLVGTLLAIPTLRLGGDYFILAVLGFQVVVSGILFNWNDVTRGSAGLHAIPKPAVFAMFDGAGLPNLGPCVVATLAAALTYFLCRRLVRAPFGRVLTSIREDEVVTQALGKDVVRFKVQVFALAGLFSGLAGVLHAYYFTAIHPSTFALGTVFFVLTAVVLGGMGSLPGSVLGAVILVLFPEALRFLPLPAALANQIAALQQIFFGLLLILFMFFRPKGLFGVHEVH
jgi:branched-chain amino acid transport system permease protein